MLVEASIVVASHLSDIGIEVNMINSQDGMEEKIYNRTQFCKYLIFRLGGDLNQVIDADKMYEEFKNM